MYEVVIFCIVMGIFMMLIAVGIGIVIGRMAEKQEAEKEINDDLELLSAKLTLIKETARLDEGERQTIMDAIKAVWKLGDLEDVGN